jgi:hypothetical protein
MGFIKLNDIKAVTVLSEGRVDCHGHVVLLFISELESLSLDMIRWLVT